MAYILLLLFSLFELKVLFLESNSKAYFGTANQIGAITTNIDISNSDKPHNSYTLELEKFSPEDVGKLAAYYREFSGFVSERVISQSSNITTLVYNSEAPKDIVLNNLRKTAEINGFNVLIRSAKDTIHVRLLSKSTNSLNYQEW